MQEDEEGCRGMRRDAEDEEGCRRMRRDEKGCRKDAGG